jgi:hypothetical protein
MTDPGWRLRRHAERLVRQGVETGIPESRRGRGPVLFRAFQVEAAQFLMTERNAIGIAVDTLSLD